MRLKLYLSQKQAEAVQQFESMALIAGKLFSKKGSSSSNTPTGEIKEARTKAEMVKAMKEHFG